VFDVCDIIALSYVRLASFIFAFMFLAYMYGSTVILTWNRRAVNPLFRSIQDRLMLLCAFSLVVLGSWMALRVVIVSHKGYESPVPLRIIRNVLLLSQGTFDSCLLGNLCRGRSGGRRGAGRVQMIRRQVRGSCSFSRRRGNKGSAVTAHSAADFTNN